MKPKFPRVVMEGTGRYGGERYRLVQTYESEAPSAFVVEKRERDELKRPRWEKVDIEHLGVREVVRIFGAMANRKRQRHWRR